MPSPFPGMNPFFERPEGWHEIHAALLLKWRNMLAPRLPDSLHVNLEQDLVFQERPAQVGVADLRVRVAGPVRARPAGVAVAETRQAVATAPTRRLRLPAVAPLPHRYLLVTDRAGRRVVTVIELLSPSNKRGADRVRYLAKRDHLLHRRVGFVEVDLLRGGPQLPLPEGAVPPAYYVLARPGRPRRDAQLWAFGLRDPLPAVPIPLRREDAPVTLDLQAALHTVYDEGFYARHLYDEPPDPPLAGEDAAWAEAIVAADRQG